MSVTTETSASERIRAEATTWFLRRDASGLSRADAEAFDAWLAQSPEHQETYEAVDAFWSATSELERHPGFEATRRWAIASADRGRRVRRAFVGGLGAVVLGLGGAALYLESGPKPLADQSFQTAVGQSATITLPDGSQLTLNTDTVLRTKADEDRRLVYLDKGQAFFRVAKDPRRPFVVAAAGRTVTAIGTAFDVRVDRGALKVVLVEGKVRVESAKPAEAVSEGEKSPLPTPRPPAAPMTTDMSAGSQLVAPDDDDWRLTRTDVARETSWLKGQLVFDDVALATIVEELNRYSTRKMVVDARLGQRRLSGNFAPGDVHGFSRALTAAGVADLREESDGEIHIIPLG